MLLVGVNMSNKYSLTVKACYLGYIVQAVVNNFLPLLFVYFQNDYKIPLYLISIIVTYNFALQILVDALSANLVLKLGYRKTALLSNALSGLGLLVLGLSAYLTSNYIIRYAIIIIAVTLMAVGGGIVEVILSPLVEALPLENKNKQMNFLHSFYCIGHIIVVLFATLFFNVFRIENWAIFSFILIIFPLLTSILFTKCPIVAPMGDEKPIGRFKLLKNGSFILLFILMVSAGAVEQAVAQWISYFAEEGLSISKSLGDLVGVVSFALCMLLSRLYFGVKDKKFNVLKLLIIASIILTALIIISTLLNVEILSLIILSASGLLIGFMWPTVYSLAGEIFTSGGTVMFSMLALGGDLGCTLGPTLVGMVSEFTSIKIGILSSIMFSILMLISSIILIKKIKQGDKNK